MTENLNVINLKKVEEDVKNPEAIFAQDILDDDEFDEDELSSGFDDDDVDDDPEANAFFHEFAN